MSRYIDETGNVYGRLIVLSHAGTKKKDNSARALWLCKCECGNTKIVSGYYLRNARTRSCGCLHKDTIRLGEGEAGFRECLANYKRKAKENNREFTLTDEEFKALTQMNCDYCGLPPSNKIKRPRQYGAFVYSGIDRVDNEIGYIFSNTKSCCDDCNKCKRDLPLDVFITNTHLRNIRMSSADFLIRGIGYEATL